MASAGMSFRKAITCQTFLFSKETLVNDDFFTDNLSQIAFVYCTRIVSVSCIG